MSIITAILVDDEDFNLKGLHNKITKLFPEIKVIGAYQQPEEAIEAIHEKSPDILFLDIQMPRIDGFELLTKLNKINFEIIFVTAYSKYAIQAFKKSASGYVLKPISDDDLTQVINSVLVNIASKKHRNVKLIELLAQNITHNDKVMVSVDNEILMIPQNKIEYIKNNKESVEIYVEGKNTPTITNKMLAFEKDLNDNFFRCHESYIVNFDFLSKINEDGFLVLLNQTKIPLAKNKKEPFMKLFLQ